jgi:multiple sugar transport system substrate-binding protein
LEPVKDLEEILAGFEKENPGIRVKVTSVDWGAAWTKITTAATSRDVPDIVQLGSTWVGAISGMGALADLKDKAAEIGGSSGFVPVAWQSSGLRGSGQVTSIPWFVDARAVFYRTDVFKKLGLTEKDLNTWDSFVKTLQKIKTANLTIDGVKIVPLGMAGKNDWNVIHNLAPWIWAAGGDFIAPDLKTSVVNSPAALKGVMFYISLVEKGFVPLEYLELNSAQVSSNFNQGACAVEFDGPYEVKTLTTPPQQGGSFGSVASKNFGVAPYPVGPARRSTFVGGSNLAIFNASKHQDAAWKVIKYLMRKEPQLAYAKATGFLPSRVEVFNDTYFSADPKRRVFKEALKYGNTYPCIASWGVLEPILTRRFGIMWDYVTRPDKEGEVDEQKIAEQLKMARDEMQVVISQER